MQELNLCPWHWKFGVLTTVSPGKSQHWHLTETLSDYSPDIRGKTHTYPALALEKWLSSTGFTDRSRSAEMFPGYDTHPCDSTLAAITLGASGAPSPLSKGSVQDLLPMVTLATQHSQCTASQVVLTSSSQRSGPVLSSMFSLVWRLRGVSIRQLGSSPCLTTGRSRGEAREDWGKSLLLPGP